MTIRRFFYRFKLAIKSSLGPAYRRFIKEFKRNPSLSDKDLDWNEKLYLELEDRPMVVDKPIHKGSVYKRPEHKSRIKRIKKQINKDDKFCLMTDGLDWKLMKTFEESTRDGE